MNWNTNTITVSIRSTYPRTLITLFVYWSAYILIHSKPMWTESEKKKIEDFIAQNTETTLTWKFWDSCAKFVGTKNSR